MRERRATKNKLTDHGRILGCGFDLLCTYFTSVPNADNHSDLILIYDNIKEEAYNWETIGLYLGFDPGELRAIQAIPQLIVQGPEGYLKELLNRWLKRTYPPDIPKLANAIGLAGNERLKAKLLQSVQ